MDFLYLELLRQKRALAALLLGCQDSSEEAARRADPLRSFSTMAGEPPGVFLNEPQNRQALLQARFNGDAESLTHMLPEGGAAFESERLFQKQYTVFVDGAASVRRFLTPAGVDSSSRRWSVERKDAAFAASSGWREAPARFGADGGALDTGGFEIAEDTASWELRRNAGKALDGTAGSAVTALSAAGFAGQAADVEMAKLLSLAFQRDARRYDGGFLSSS